MGHYANQVSTRTTVNLSRLLRSILYRSSSYGIVGIAPSINENRKVFLFFSQVNLK